VSDEANKDVVRAYVDAFNRGDMDALRGLVTEDAEVHGVLGWGGMDTVLPVWEQLHAAFGITLQIEDLIAEGDVVAARGTSSAARRERRSVGRAPRASPTRSSRWNGSCCATAASAAAGARATPRPCRARWG